jgi:hypothetical protein
MFHAGARTDKQNDMRKLIVGFCNFTDAPKTVGISRPVVYAGY